MSNPPTPEATAGNPPSKVPVTPFAPESLPLWPRKDVNRCFAIPLRKGFSMTHSSVSLDEEAKTYCAPQGVATIIEKTLESTKGGSILVTGYRGVGKTSAVMHALHRYKDAMKAKAGQSNDPEKLPLIIHLDLSSISSAHDLLLLLFEVLNDGLSELEFWRKPEDLFQAYLGEEVRAMGNAAATGLNEVKDWLRKRYRGAQQMEEEDTSCVIEFVAKEMVKILSQNKKVNELKASLGQLMTDLDKPCTSSKKDDLQEKLSEVEKKLNALEKHKKVRIRLRKIDGHLERTRKNLMAIEEESSGVKTQLAMQSVEEQVRQCIKKELSDMPEVELIEQTKTFLRQKCLEPLRKDIQSQEDNEEQGSSVYVEEGGTLGGSHVVGKHLSLYQYRFKKVLDSVNDFSLCYDAGNNRQLQLQIIFVIDELDKLPVKIRDKNPDQTETDRFFEVQRVVADLKFLLTEARSHQIFIAGKDVEDAWHTDRNKREGLFESIFPKNIYINTLFSGELEVSEPPHDLKNKDLTKEDYWQAIANTIGITRNSLTFKTAMLILPILGEKFLGAVLKYGDEADKKAWREVWEVDKPGFEVTKLSLTRLRIFLQHLTYKGRGIPRKILREFYGFIVPYRQEEARIEGPDDYKSAIFGDQNGDFLILAINQNELQRMGFYSRVMDLLEQNFEKFRTLSDKGCLSIFYLIDHILKFYETGFTTHEISGTEVSSTRQEMFPTQWLAAEVIGILNGHLLRRRSLRTTEFYLLPDVKHDLRKLVRNYAGEQVELRFTEADFEMELQMLDQKLKLIEKTTPEQRIESVQSQIRQGIIYERLGRIFDARLAYAKAVRWLRSDMRTYERPHSNDPADIATTVKITKEFRITFISLIVQALHRLGRVYEEENEHHSALRCYQESVRLHETIGNHTVNLPVDNPEWPYGVKLGELMLHPNDLARSTCYTWSPVDYRRGVRPMALEDEAQDFALTLNHAAIAHEKLWERSATNAYLLKSLNYLQSVNDEYGVVEQMFLIGTLMVRRRDMRTAAMWYLRALELVRDLRQGHVESHDKAGFRWTTIGFPSDLHATLLMYLGDVFYATGGWGILRQGKVTLYQGRGESHKLARIDCENIPGSRLAPPPLWLVQVCERTLDLVNEMEQRAGNEPPKEKDNKGVPNILEFPAYRLYENARVLLESGSHASATLDVLSRELLFTSEHITQILGEINARQVTPPNPAPEGTVSEENKLLVDQLWHELQKTWKEFWIAAERMAYRLLDTNPSRFREGTTQWGHVQDRRRLGQLFRACAEVLKEVGVTLVFLREEWEWEGLGTDQPEGKNRRFSLMHGSLNTLVSIMIGVEKFSIESSGAMQKPGKQGALHGTPSLRNKEGCEWLIQWSFDVEKKLLGTEHPERNRRMLQVAEWAGLTSYMLQRDAVEDSRLGRSGLTLAQLYFLNIWRLTTNIRTHFSSKRANIENFRDFILCLDRLYFHTKRFLVKALNVFLEEPTRERILRTFISEAYFCLGDLALFRICFIEALNEKTAVPEEKVPASEEKPAGGDPGHAPSQTPPAQAQAHPLENIFGREMLKMIASAVPEGTTGSAQSRWVEFLKKQETERKEVNGEDSSILDTEVEDLRRQAMEYYTKGLSIVGLELDDFIGRYPLAPDVFLSHMNLSDHVLHNDICRALQTRHLHGTQMAAPPVSQQGPLEEIEAIRRGIVNAIETSRNPYEDGGKWIEVLKRVLTCVEKMRTDRACFEVDEKNNHIVWKTILPERCSLKIFE